MNDKLLPCPFCGGKAHIKECLTPFVYCGNCDTQLGVKQPDQLDTKERLIKAWNTRYIDKNKPDIIFLPERTNVIADGNVGMRRGQ